MTGPISFKEGRRVLFKLDLVKLKHGMITKVGEWSPSIGRKIPYFIPIWQFKVIFLFLQLT